METAEKQGQMHTTELRRFTSMGMSKRKAAEDRFSSEGEFLTQGITSNFLLI